MKILLLTDNITIEREDFYKVLRNLEGEVTVFNINKDIKILNKNFENTNNKLLSAVLVKNAGIDIIPTVNINQEN